MWAYIKKKSVGYALLLIPVEYTFLPCQVCEKLFQHSSSNMCEGVWVIMNCMSGNAQIKNVKMFIRI